MKRYTIAWNSGGGLGNALATLQILNAGIIKRVDIFGICGGNTPIINTIYSARIELAKQPVAITPTPANYYIPDDRQLAYADAYEYWNFDGAAAMFGQIIPARASFPSNARVLVGDLLYVNAYGTGFGSAPGTVTGTIDIWMS